jgi:hypothetical protein
MKASFTGECTWCGHRKEVWSEYYVEKLGGGAAVQHSGDFCSATCYDSFCNEIEESAAAADALSASSLAHAQSHVHTTQAISAQAINGPSPNALPNYFLAANGQIGTVAPPPTPKPRRRRPLPEPDKFPEHEHVWTVVEIENNPVGVTCSICDHDYSLSDEPVINLDQVIQLKVGAPIRIKDAWVAANGEKGDAHMYVRDFQVTRTPQGVEINVRLTTPYA